MKWFRVEGFKYGDQPFIKRASANGKSICLINDGAGLYALAAKCPHAGADLSRGWCADGKLVCPYHRFSYDLVTGKGSPGQNDFVETYSVKVDSNNIYVGFDTFWDKVRRIFKS